MSQRILSRTQQQTLNNTQSQLDNHYIPIGIKTNVYKFRQVSGSIYLTRFGELTNKVQADTQNQLFQLYTGKEPIVVVWDGSTNLSANSENNTIKQQCNIGKYETGYLTQPKEITLETKTKNLYGKEYAMDIIKNNITLQFNNWIPTEDDIRDYFYVILDEKAKSIKWLQIESAIQVFNESSNNFQYCEVAFTNVGDKYTQTGKSILDFIQVQPIGDGYCFPKEEHKANGDIVVSLDESKLPHNVKPANTLQLDFTSGAGLSSILCFGRRQSNLIDSNNGVYNYEIDKPQILFIYDIREPIISEFFYNQPNLNSYLMVGAQPTKEGIWKSYKDAYQGNSRIGEYNILNQKEVMTGLKHDQEKVRASNSNVNEKTNWSNKELFDVDFQNQLKFNTNPYCKSVEDFKTKLKYCDFLNINSMINFSSNVFDYDYRETKKWKLTDTLGILGNIVNIVVGGLDIGWTSSNILKDVQNDLNIIIPCITYEDGMLALDKAAPLPLDVFFDDKSQKVLPTSTNVLSSWRVRFTDQFIDESQVRDNAEIGKGGKGVWNTKYLGQTKYEDGTWINDDHTPFKFNPKSFRAYNPSNDSFNFIIDYLDFKAIASCDYRISCYDRNNDPIYYYVGETNSKARGDIRIWGNAIKFNFWDRYNTSGEINYPEKPIPPKPPVDFIGFDVPLPNQDNLLIDMDDWKQLSNYPTIKFKKEWIMNPGNCGPSHCAPDKFNLWLKVNWPAGDNYNLIGFRDGNYDIDKVSYKLDDPSVNYSLIKQIYIRFENGTEKFIDVQQKEGQNFYKKINMIEGMDKYFYTLWSEDEPEKYAAIFKIDPNRVYEENYWSKKLNYYSEELKNYVGYDLFYKFNKYDISILIDNVYQNVKIDVDISFNSINAQKVVNDGKNKLVPNNYFLWTGRIIEEKDLLPKINLKIQQIKVFY